MGNYRAESFSEYYHADQTIPGSIKYMVNIKPTILTNAVILLFQPLIYRKNRMTSNIVINFLTICYSLRQPFDIREELKHSFFMKYSKWSLSSKVPFTALLVGGAASKFRMKTRNIKEWEKWGDLRRWGLAHFTCYLSIWVGLTAGDPPLLIILRKETNPDLMKHSIIFSWEISK